MYTIAYFSPTGNAKHVANRLAHILKGNVTEIFPLEFKDPLTLNTPDHLVILYPIHGFNASRTVRRWARALPEDHSAKVSLLAVGCTTTWLNDAASLALRQPLEKKGYTIVVDEVIAMPLTFIMAFPDDVIHDQLDEMETRLGGIATRLGGAQEPEKVVPVKAKLMSAIGKVESPAARLFGLELYANDDCISCGTCWRNCPEGNIKQSSKDKPSFSFNCLMCMRCIYSCQQKAISPRFSKFIPIKSGYNLKRHLANEP